MNITILHHFPEDNRACFVAQAPRDVADGALHKGIIEVQPFFGVMVQPLPVALLKAAAGAVGNMLECVV